MRQIMEHKRSARSRLNRRHRARTDSEERELIENWTRKHRAEEERRSRMATEEKLAESGSWLQRRLEDDPSLILLFQPSPTSQAQCIAEYCHLTRDAPRRQYFHVSCLEQMLDLPKLAPTRFKLDTAAYPWMNNWPYTWGLMPRKWFENSGRIDLGLIANYIDAVEEYEEKSGDFDTMEIERQLKHQKECMEAQKSCECPPVAEAPVSPALSDNETNEDNVCSLGEMLSHEYVGEMGPLIVLGQIFGQHASLMAPEQEG